MKLFHLHGRVGSAYGGVFEEVFRVFYIIVTFAVVSFFLFFFKFLAVVWRRLRLFIRVRHTLLN